MKNESSRSKALPQGLVPESKFLSNTEGQSTIQMFKEKEIGNQVAKNIPVTAATLILALSWCSVPSSCST